MDPRWVACPDEHRGGRQCGGGCGSDGRLGPLDEQEDLVLRGENTDLVLPGALRNWSIDLAGDAGRRAGDLHINRPCEWVTSIPDGEDRIAGQETKLGLLLHGVELVGYASGQSSVLVSEVLAHLFFDSIEIDSRPLVDFSEFFCRHDLLSPCPFWAVDLVDLYTKKSLLSRGREVRTR
ncbi:MAG TPA: hypothetical protein DCY48_00745 [Candidatus Magasanikbacteria bacterium]|nr:MAG: hypothetical protein A3I74_02325 [Candidatus Magasanikbacteria bacterium RIFCSPLOWO2_02_FULL_47_16]OGH79655.1 MAG: hypothetical protein A3C10_01075 [Candidatus Magasanikbacteria bacterium RIFCSPHIGHO2_02_FULL_48_18]OGH83134.1 MAG: hypothetical protein A3G08_00140 [Candidatus Magasanikbacteria bacterium RIFCSPLOWO2_12_FULL_47_9b]HAZ28288.1 hypothetical protein [Candidatus Magasanikbacteria bacterium]